MGPPSATNKRKNSAFLDSNKLYLCDKAIGLVANVGKIEAANIRKTTIAYCLTFPTTHQDNFEVLRNVVVSHCDMATFYAPLSYYQKADFDMAEAALILLTLRQT
jgi:hypothetical protein